MQTVVASDNNYVMIKVQGHGAEHSISYWFWKLKKSKMVKVKSRMETRAMRMKEKTQVIENKIIHFFFRELF
ncbi:hypothetical protein AtNW77_Chr2g0242741 [Arabidopsis thaliana]|nr:uncharacterized protein AT2G23985 [Arabidopsis thaliana]NP_001323860.1 uncharacterized protein AT2G23985 [Arabidopsis thaliana]NP_001323861.1 uncharacterized protein AT2G23985 [Arabidopsis thaliana]NP_001323862.1 uncharacterized protein AT2G23985 [Arabidopsis thaliana]NP_001323874.1 uncharacterized protein AT2G23985 [Arabidopsis thaliana]KAG7637231.1 hypothetical protein ISN45_At02g017890 [Arabidopsis thaliana x Arabidopsis arenosa]AEC07512.1 hypothetical protein AT2G23985 [Arabidopsis tha|eukprot:NP_001031405.1 hypothetical protein AT2G23985 [Arabidopsis thaliana]